METIISGHRIKLSGSYLFVDKFPIHIKDVVIYNKYDWEQDISGEEAIRRGLVYFLFTNVSGVEIYISRDNGTININVRNATRKFFDVSIPTQSKNKRSV